MVKFVVVETSDDPSAIELLSFLVKRNFERVSLLQRLEDHPYLRGEADLSDGALDHTEPLPHLGISDEERVRLIKWINSGSMHNRQPPQQMAPSGLTMQQQQQQQQQQQGGNCQMPATSSNAPSSYTSGFIYPMKSEPQQATFEPVPQTMDTDVCLQNNMEAIRELYSHDVIKRKTPRRAPEESCKATCKICGHDVMYSPQRTWNLMRHVWIMHDSPKPYQCSLCGYSHIKPYVRKHIDTQHKSEPATIIDLKSPELEAEWHSLLDQCFGVTYRKWKHIKDDTQGQQEHQQQQHHQQFQPDFSTDVMTTL